MRISALTDQELLEAMKTAREAYLQAWLQTATPQELYEMLEQIEVRKAELLGLRHLETAPGEKP